MPVTARGGGATSPCRPTKVTFWPAGAFAAPPGRGLMASGSIEFHSRQASQRPAHLGVTAPQD